MFFNLRSTQIYLWHVAMIGPMLYYIGNNGKETNIYAYTVLSILAISILFIVRKPNLKTYRGIIRLIHYLVYIPLFLYISYKNKDLPEWAFTIIKYTGISVSAIHFYLLFKKSKLGY